MPFRDDRDALRAHRDALEQERSQLERELAQRDRAHEDELSEHQARIAELEVLVSGSEAARFAPHAPAGFVTGVLALSSIGAALIALSLETGARRPYTNVMASFPVVAPVHVALEAEVVGSSYDGLAPGDVCTVTAVELPQRRMWREVRVQCGGELVYEAELGPLAFERSPRPHAPLPFASVVDRGYVRGPVRFALDSETSLARAWSSEPGGWEVVMRIDNDVSYARACGAAP
jgi:hypothetical protein